MATTRADPFSDWISLVDAAATLGVHPQSVRRLIKQKQLPFELHFGKYVIRRDRLQQLAAVYDPKPGRKRGVRLF